MSCKHENVIVHPPGKSMKVVGGNVQLDNPLGPDSIIECRECGAPIPNEDVHLYKENHVFVGIPAEMVDDAAAKDE